MDDFATFVLKADRDLHPSHCLEYVGIHRLLDFSAQLPRLPGVAGDQGIEIEVGCRALGLLAAPAHRRLFSEAVELGEDVHLVGDLDPLDLRGFGRLFAGFGVKGDFDDLGFLLHFLRRFVGTRPYRSELGVRKWLRYPIIELSRLGENDRVGWLNGNISAQTFATIRLADTWSHGLHILTGLDKEIIDTPRLRHIAWLGWATLPSAFKKARIEYPEEVRIELVGPGYARWVYGPEDSEHIIRGQAADWCRVAVRFLTADQTESLSAEGALAEAALLHADIRP